MFTFAISSRDELLVKPAELVSCRGESKTRSKGGPIRNQLWVLALWRVLLIPQPAWCGIPGASA